MVERYLWEIVVDSLSDYGEGLLTGFKLFFGIKNSYICLCLTLIEFPSNLIVGCERVYLYYKFFIIPVFVFIVFKDQKNANKLCSSIVNNIWTIKNSE